jgi:hypothetical protein
MVTTVVLAFLAGFWGGNGLPYFVAGSTGDGRNPGPFADSAAGNVLVGWVMVVGAALFWHFAHVPRHPSAGWSAVALGVLAVGLIHSRTWRHNPWPWRRPAALPSQE